MNEYRPPKVGLRLLGWFCQPGLYETIEGDLLEQFEVDVEEVGVKRARRRFIQNAIKFLRPGILLRNKFTIRPSQLDMLQHFFKIFIRATWKNATYSFINIAGLAAGLACSILILLWVVDEASCDTFHKDHSRIFQIMGSHSFPAGTTTYDNTPGPLAPALKELPEVEESCRLTSLGGRVLFNYEDKSIYQEGIYAESSVFNLFTIPILDGDHLNPVRDNNSIAISQKLAGNYFKGQDAIGKIVRLNNSLDAKVTAVFRDLPENSTLRFEFILPYTVYAKKDPYNQEWGAWTGGSSYVKLQTGARTETVNKKINDTFTKPKIWPRWDSNVELFLFPLADWRLHNNFKDGKQEGGRITYVKGFSIVAIFILLIACVNFMNLSTARSISRSREVGVRKVVGAGRLSIVRQFIGESILISFISLFFGLLIVHLLQPYFNELTGRKIIIDYTNPIIYGSLVAITLLTGIVAGSYPAFFLSSLQAMQVLKGKFSDLRGAGVRKALVVFQFSLSVILIICAIVVHQQLDYMRNKNLGFDKKNTFYIMSTGRIRKTAESFRREALQNPLILSVAQADANPMEIVDGMVLDDYAWPGKTKADNIIFKYLQCDSYFLTALGFTLLEGRNFSPEIASDSNAYIINQEAARKMKLSDPVGQQLIAPRKGQIVGIVKDFHSTGLQMPIEPVIISMMPENARRIFIHYEPGHAEDALNYIQGIYKKFEPAFPMEYKFMDETFGSQYQDEIMTGKLSTGFTLMAIAISSLGLFGLASFTAERRAKEISLRKVLGATVGQMISLLCRDYVLLVGIALMIGLPMAWWGAQKFLDTYQFHTTLSVSLFVMTALSVLLMALLTVSYQSAKAAMANPADGLSYE